jgi:hypothetical protein
VCLYQLLKLAGIIWNPSIVYVQWTKRELKETILVHCKVLIWLPNSVSNEPEQAPELTFPQLGRVFFIWSVLFCWSLSVCLSVCLSVVCFLSAYLHAFLPTRFWWDLLLNTSTKSCLAFWFRFILDQITPVLYVAKIKFYWYSQKWLKV